MIREKRSDKKHDFVREKLDMLTPVLMSKVLGKGTAKGDGSMFGEELVRQFLKSLDASQINAIMSSLGPEQVVTMAEIYQKYGEREVAREKKEAAAGAAPSESAHARGGSAEAPPAPAE
jgi:hypothetical protein